MGPSYDVIIMILAMMALQFLRPRYFLFVAHNAMDVVVMTSVVPHIWSCITMTLGVHDRVVMYLCRACVASVIVLHSLIDQHCLDCTPRESATIC